MPTQEKVRTEQSLERHGLHPTGDVYWNLSPAVLVEEALARGEGQLASMGAFAAVTAPHTGRSPKDKFIVREPSSEDEIDWGPINQPFSQEDFERVYRDILVYLEERDLFVADLFAGADPEYRIGARLISTSAWQTLFARNMFIRPTTVEQETFEPDWTVLHAPLLQLDPQTHHTRSPNAVVMHFGKKLILIAGTKYAGEIKKSIFTVMNYWLPQQNVLPMHCSANVARDGGDTALFFGLSGTGKTTLSTSPDRDLIGDDEHGWSDEGIFNFEGGCYAKVINLSAEGEPEIFTATQQFGTVLENVLLDSDTRAPLYEDDQITENTRACYPIDFIPHYVASGQGDHPRNVFFLTADAFGVLPPIACLTTPQVKYHFLSGYTAKVAGTERGVSDPQATFSTCFGAPFLPRHPHVYADMLGERVNRHHAKVWLVNTGWTGGPFGVGSRMKLADTRAIIRAALEGQLDDVDTWEDPIFGLHVPRHVPGVPDEVLTPRSTWQNPTAYDEKARMLAEKFRENFKQFEEFVSAEVRAAGPKVE